MSASWSGICRCAATKCTNNSKNCEFSFFRFPKDTDRAQIWVVACNREDLLGRLENLHKSNRICGAHFEDKMFLNNLHNRLHKHAVPTLFPSLEDNSTEDVKKFAITLFKSAEDENISQQTCDVIVQENALTASTLSSLIPMEEDTDQSLTITNEVGHKQNPNEHSTQFTENVIQKVENINHEPEKLIAESSLSSYTSKRTADLSPRELEEDLTKKIKTEFDIDEVNIKLEEIKEPVEYHNDDEFTSFGINIASQLRQLPLEQALRCQSHIMTFLTEQRIAFLKSERDKQDFDHIPIPILESNGGDISVINESPFSTPSVHMLWEDNESGSENSLIHSPPIQGAEQEDR